MAYRKRTQQSRKMAAARAAAEVLRLSSSAPEYPGQMPDLRRTIIIIDHDFGTVEHRIDLYRTRRIDCYRVVADGTEWKKRAGWSTVLEAIRKSFIRVGANVD
jgi:hypothetical protein